MNLCIDSGNSRIKWGLHDGGCWLASGVVAQTERASLGQLQLPGRPTRILVSNVAGPTARSDLLKALACWSVAPTLVSTQGQAGGIRNGYEIPDKLGVDRWCALIGAHAHQPGAVLVVMAGTATTIDSLSEDGEFLGGLILPGIQAMHHALAQGTADLPVAQGKYCEYPLNTDDAITTGCLEATAGAIERGFARLHRTGSPVCLLSGGNAAQLAAHLSIPCRTVENLVLEGLAVLAHGG